MGGRITDYAVVTAVDAAGRITQLTSKWGKTLIHTHGLTNVPPVYGAPHRVYVNSVT